MEPLREIESINLRNEALWGNIAKKLGLGSKSTTSNSVVKSLGGGKYTINGNLVEKLGGVSEQQLLSYDWNNGKLSFLKSGRWAAKELRLQISGGVEQVTLFYGVWLSGDFVGNFFGEFDGQSFEGRFQSSYKSYRSDPSTFVNGTVVDHVSGVLGMPKVDNVALDASSQKKSISLLEMQVGHFCNLTDDKGVMHSFQITKCCDDKSMDIELQEQTGQKRGIRIPWNEIRKNNDPTMFRRLSSIRIGGRPQIPYLFANDRVGTIASIEVSRKPGVGASSKTVNTYKMDMSLIRPLRYSKPNATVHLLTQDEAERFGKINKDLENNAMQYHIRNLEDGIRMGVITGYDGYPHLASVFGNEKGSSVSHPKYATTMKWLDEFMELFVLRMMIGRTMKGVYINNEVGRREITNQLTNIVAKAKGGSGQAAQSAPLVAKTGNPTPRKSMIPEAFGQIDRIIEGALKQNRDGSRIIV